MDEKPAPADAAMTPHKRRKRYSGKNPRRFEEKYKEHGGDTATVEKVLASGKTPAGTHRSIMVAEILAALDPKPGDLAVDCTLGYGGHAQEILAKILPGGKLIGLDADPLQLPKTEARLRALGFDETVFTAHRSNFAGLPQVLAAHFGAPASMPTIQHQPRADVILADLGLSSMQIDDPARGFSVKFDGPLDMRMNPQRGQPASALLERTKPDALAEMLTDFSDEPNATTIASAIAGKHFATTLQLAVAVRSALPKLKREESDLTVRRVFQALRIAVNDEFSALETLLRNLPSCLKPGGRVAILTFHSGEDRRVKKAFAAGYQSGIYSVITQEVIRPTADEIHSNPRSAPAKLRWAIRAD
jgi:16S rRNA (cytosine1402-N4)-methyltransferase